MHVYKYVYARYHIHLKVVQYLIYCSSYLVLTAIMGSMNIGYELLRKSSTQRPQLQTLSFVPDRMMPVSTMHSMALKASEKIILLMNNTRLLTRHHRLASMNDVLLYLTVITDFSCSTSPYF